MLFPVRDSIPSRRRPVVNTGVIVLQLFQGTLSLATAPAGAAGVAWFAHIGGLVFGVALAPWMKASGRVRPAPARYAVWYRY